MRTALVTGGTGMVGSALVERLVAEGSVVRALVRDMAAAAWLADLGARLVPGDLENVESLREATAGCDLVFHAAAALGPFGTYEPFSLYGPVPIPCVAALTCWYMFSGTIAE